MFSSQVLSASEVGYTLPSGEELFAHLTVGVGTRDRIGLVGVNGAGKSTLLQMLAGLRVPARGEVHRRGQAFYLPQQVQVLWSLESTAYEALSRYTNEWWQPLIVVEQQFGLRVGADQRISSLSEGEQVKLALALGFTIAPELLILDEPTNHLDIEGVDQLIGLVQDFPGAVIIVSHNQSVIEQTATSIWELEQGNLSVYGGIFSEYLEQKEQQQSAQLRHFRAAQKTWRVMQRQETKSVQYAASRRRSTKRKIATGNHQQTGRSGGNLKDWAARTESKRLRLYTQRFAAVNQQLEQYRPDRQSRFYWALPRESAKRHRLFRVEGGSVRIQRKLLLNDLCLELYYGDRVALTGPNGAGKSSLVKTLLSEDSSLFSLQGKIVKKESLSFAILDQQYSGLNLHQSLIENMQQPNPLVEYERLRQQLGNFGFKEDAAIHRVTDTLSGGELTRLALAVLSCQPLDCLILDEPSNNLDRYTLQVLTEALNEFPGGLMVISHDRSFLQQLNLNQSWTIKDNRITVQEGFAI